MKKILILLITIFFVLSCVSSPSAVGSGGESKPEWVDNKHSIYSEAEYMVEVGQGASLKDAKRNGAASLATIFKTSIKVETNIKTRYKELSSGDSTEVSEETTFDQDISQLADQELVNVNYGESWTNNLGQVFVLAYIDRQATGNIYRDRIGKNSSTVMDFLNRTSVQSSKIREYAFYDAAYVVAQNNQLLLDQLEILNMVFRKTLSIPYDLNEIRNSRSEAAVNMGFNIQVEGDVDQKVVSVIKDELTAFGFSIDPAGTLSVSGDVKLEKVELDNDYKNVRYYLNLNIQNEEGIPVVTIEENNRISAVSESDAENRAYLDMEKIIKKELIGELVSYFDGFVK